MIVNLLINVLIYIVSVLLSWLPTVQTLPTINGYDVDSALVQGMGYLNYVMTVVWPLQILFQGFLFIMGYYMIKITLKFFFGGRSPVD